MFGREAADRERPSRERSDEDPRGPTEDFFESLLFLMGEGKEGAIREGRLFDEYCGLGRRAPIRTWALIRGNIVSRKKKSIS